MRMPSVVSVFLMTAKVPRLDEEAESEDEIESDIDFGTSDTDELV